MTVQVRRNKAYRSFAKAPLRDWWRGVCLAEVRTGPVTGISGLARLTLFASGPAGGPSHPRLQVQLEPPADPRPPQRLSEPPGQVLGDRGAFEAWFEQSFAAAGALLRGDDLGSEPNPHDRSLLHGVIAQRKQRLFAEARELLQEAGRGWPEDERARACRWLVQREALAFAGRYTFPDADSGARGFRGERAYVHVLERLIESLPREGTRAFALLPGEGREAVRRQRRQAQAHLDHLMRHVHAQGAIAETDVERSVGGRLIDARTRQVVSEDPASAGSVVPAFQLLRIAPASSHALAGAYVYRDGGTLRRRDGTPVEVAPADLRAIPVAAAQLTFERAPRSPLLRAGVRFDWDESGAAELEPRHWLGASGDWEIQAALEVLGLELAEVPTVTEFRSDTAATTRFDRDAILEILAGALELGSVYTRVDESGEVLAGAGALGRGRRQGWSDRLQLEGLGEGRHFRWPLERRLDHFTVVAAEDGGGPWDMGEVFLRQLSDLEQLDFYPNPRLRRVVEERYAVIEASGARLTARGELDAFDRGSGAWVRRAETLVIDLRPEAPPGRQLLGTHVVDPGSREVYRVWLDAGVPEVVAELERWERGDAGFSPRPVPERTMRLPLVRPLKATLSREQTRDDPRLFEALFDAVRSGLPIAADTDLRAEIHSGLVTAIELERLAAREETGVERWRARLRARCGKLELDFLLKRNGRGEPVAFCLSRAPDEEEPGPERLWRHLPDVGALAWLNGEWAVNRSMLERQLVQLEIAPWAEGGVDVAHEHLESAFEVAWAALAGYPYTIVHENRRYGFADELAWEKTCRRLEALRDDLAWEGEAG